MQELEEIKLFMQHLADLSGSIITNYFRAGISIDTKTDNSPVTIADIESEESMREAIMDEYPEHGIIGEELGAYNEKAEYQWILDPIDGTKSFICGAISFGTLIAFLKNGKPLLGVVNHPILNELLIGDNKETRLNGNIVKIRECNILDEAVLLTTDHLDIEKYQNMDKFNTLIRKVKLYRNWGDCYGYYLLATGFADIMIDPIMSDWDKMAIIPIINGAGGIITDYQGGDPVKGESIIASSKGLHRKVIKILNEQ